MELTLTLNGQARTFEGLENPVALEQVIAALGLKADRVAVELNGAIVARGHWSETPVANGDKLEVVHFVGGGSSAAWRECSLNPAEDPGWKKDNRGDQLQRASHGDAQEPEG